MELYRLAALIPAYNESETIGKVVSQVRDFCDVYVVDDYSTDNTFMQAELNGAFVIRNTGDNGYESALGFGYREVAQKDYDYILTLDADGQHNPNYIKVFFKHLSSSSDASIIIAQRKRLPRISEKFFSQITRRFFNIKDAFSGFKCYKVKDFLNYSFSDHHLTGLNFLNLALVNNKEIITFDISIEDRKDSPRFGSSFISNLILIRSISIFFILLIMRRPN